MYTSLVYKKLPLDPEVHYFKLVNSLWAIFQIIRGEVSNIHFSNILPFMSTSPTWLGFSDQNIHCFSHLHPSHYMISPFYPNISCLKIKKFLIMSHISILAGKRLFVRIRNILTSWHSKCLKLELLTYYNQ